MNSIESGVRTINDIEVLALDGLWEATMSVPREEKLKAALGYAGCAFYDEENRFVKSKSVTVAGIGGQPLAYAADSDAVIAERINRLTEGGREMMSTSAFFSYLNSGEKSQAELYDTVTNIGHLSIAHTVSVNIIVAGISEGAELELNLQRDLLHISKVTNARTNIQTRPPIVVTEQRLLPMARLIEQTTTDLTSAAREFNDPDELEMLNGFFPVNKATLLMLSGDLSNFRKVAKIRDDRGKEKELRDVADTLHTQLSRLWPEIYNEKEN